MTAQSNLPTGALRRLAGLAGASVQSGAAAILKGKGSAAPERLANELARLRGLATKLGQMLSYVDGLIPEAQYANYETALQTLQTATQPSNIVDVRKIVETELGAPIDRCFAEWNDDPIASASIGQVHRARLFEGLAVAVKVQHPGIAQAIQADLGTAEALERVVRLAMGASFGTRPMFDELAAAIRQELDYRLEAAAQNRFREFHRGDPRIYVPSVVDSHTTTRVLTSELVDGETFATACAAPEEDRRRWCETLWRFAFRAILARGMYNADPHPGNYFFQGDGRVVFVDFGCTRKMSSQRVSSVRRMHAAAYARDETAFKAAVSSLLDVSTGPLAAPAQRFVRLCLEPVFASPFRVTREYSAALIHEARSFGKSARSVPSGDRSPPAPPELFLMNRLHFGLYSVLARLDATVDYKQTEQAFVLGAVPGKDCLP